MIPFRMPPPLSPTPIILYSYSPQSVKGRALDEEIQALRHKGAVEPAPPTPCFFSRMFVVTKATRGWRPIIDLSTLNLDVDRTPFRMETSQTVLRAVRRNDWMVSIDLKDAYLQIPIHPASHRFLRFTALGKTWQFRVLCFGLSTAPQVFTRVMAPVSGFLHQLGIRMLRYLDDWLILASSQEEACWARDKVLSLCQELGDCCQPREVYSHSLSDHCLLGNQDRLTDFPCFGDSFENRKVLLNSRRISVLKGAVCEVLESLARPPRLFGLPSFE